MKPKMLNTCISTLQDRKKINTQATDRKMGGLFLRKGRNKQLRAGIVTAIIVATCF